MRTKRGQVAVYVIIALILVGAIVLIGILKSGEEPEIFIVECNSSADCVPSECCNAATCVPVNQTPDCSGVDCVIGCESFPSAGGGFLGCGSTAERAQCSCINNKCTSA